MRRALIAIALLSCTAQPVTTQTPTPGVTTTPLPSATASASPSRQFGDLTLAAAGDIRGEHALVLPNDHELFRPPGAAQQFVTGVTAFAPR